jgi:hypothetical protein
MNTMHRSFAFALFTVTAATAAACSSPAEDTSTGDVGDTQDAITGAACDRTALLAHASGARKTAIERGLEWYDARIPYSQSRNHAGYRTDCSGFVSMCWETGQSYTTASFAAGDGVSHLGSYSDLLPGDALLYRTSGEGHVMLFAGWSDSSHANACVIEERSTALGMQFHTRPVSSLHSMGYKPIRSDEF